jgi:hypothetical protein
MEQIVQNAVERFPMTQTTLSNPAAKRRATRGWTSKAIESSLSQTIPDARKDLVHALVTVVWNFVEVGRSGKAMPMDKLVMKLEPPLSLLLDAEPKKSPPPSLAIAAGQGLGAPLTRREGIRRLEEYSELRPIESWAGKLASAGELRSLGIASATLNNWRRTNAIVGLRRDKRNFLYPLEQFIDGRPIDGIARVLAVAPNVRAGWLWMGQPHAALDGQRPIDALRNGLIDEVAKTAECDFD